MYCAFSVGPWEQFAADEDLEQAVSLSGTHLIGREMKICYSTARHKPRAREDEEERKAKVGR
jgi:hypothetical protein